MKTVKQELIFQLKSGEKIGRQFRIIAFGLALLSACLCNSCDPDDDTTTDGTSGATSANTLKSALPQQELMQATGNCYLLLS